MLRVAVTRKVAPIEQRSIELPCPRCRLRTWVRLSQVLRGRTFLCRGCHAGIIAHDRLGRARRSIQELDAAVSSLFEGFGE